MKRMSALIMILGAAPLLAQSDNGSNSASGSATSSATSSSTEVDYSSLERKANHGKGNGAEDESSGVDAETASQTGSWDGLNDKVDGDNSLSFSTDAVWVEK